MDKAIKTICRTHEQQFFSLKHKDILSVYLFYLLPGKIQGSYMSAYSNVTLAEITQKEVDGYT